jgi:hypothetical protein
MVHSDTKHLSLLKGQQTTGPREYLFVAIADFSREPLIVDDRNGSIVCVSYSPKRSEGPE